VSVSRRTGGPDPAIEATTTAKGWGDVAHIERADRIERHKAARLPVFLGGGTLSTAAVVLADPGPARLWAVLLGGLLMGLGVVVEEVSARRDAAAHEEEVELLRNELHIERADGRDRQERIEELERETSLHSRAIVHLFEH
jgi:hypothetical protein